MNLMYHIILETIRDRLKIHQVYSVLFKTAQLHSYRFTEIQPAVHNNSPVAVFVHHSAVVCVCVCTHK